jgi:hypothetical protein
MTTEITTAAERSNIATIPQSADAEAWSLMQRRALALSTSSIVPKAYQGRDNLANVIIALEIADRVGANPLQVMQNLYIVQGRPSWSSSFLIATVNTCGRFTPMRFETRGGDDPAKQDYAVRAIATDRESGIMCAGPWITWAMVKAEGWYEKTGSKWKTLPELMFMYRAAGFWSRVYAPEVSMGLLTREEAEDITDHGRGPTTTNADRAALASLQATLEAQASQPRPIEATNELADAAGAGDAQPNPSAEEN